MDDGGQWRVNPLGVIRDQPAKVGLAYVWLVLGILAHYVYGVLVPVAAGTTTSPVWGTRNQILARIVISFIVGAFVFTSHWGKIKDASDIRAFIAFAEGVAVDALTAPWTTG